MCSATSKTAAILFLCSFIYVLYIVSSGFFCTEEIISIKSGENLNV